MALTNDERLIRLETQRESTNDKLDDLHNTMEDFIKSANRKYASKLTEKIVYGIAGLLLTIVITALVKGVI